VLIGAVFLLLGLGGIAGVGYMAFSSRAQNLTELDRRIAEHNHPVAPVARARPARGLHRALTMPHRFAPLLARAQIEPTPQMISILIGVLALSFSLVFAIGGIVFALATVAVLAALPFVYVNARARRRTNALTDALPFYIDGVRQLMSVGNSLPQALTRAIPTAAEPIQAYLGPAARRIELGAPVGESVQQMADRLAIPELAMFAAAIRSNLRFGGSMATILNNLSQIMRERIRINRELSAAISEIKVSTQVLIAIPIFLIVLLFSSSPIYRTFFFSDPRGHHMALFAAVLQGLGIIIMMQLKRLSF
jgi:tight adherence protein B